ncbi:MAG: AMP-binding protein [Gemmatimonadales bacterium]|nr:AMP-binding protein [Gemmatimonadales bacterium]
MDVGSLPTRNARHWPDRLALVFEDRRLSWRDLNARINRAANALRLAGVAKGDAVALLLPNTLELVELYWALAKLGAVAVPLSPLLRGPTLESLIRDSDAVALVTTRELAPEVVGIRAGLSSIPEHRLYLIDGSEPGFADYHAATGAASSAEPPASGITGHDPCHIIYSSGTTGDPKGIIHTHRMRAYYGINFSRAWRMGGDAVVLQAGSLIFNGSMLMTVPWMYTGACLVVQRRFDPSDYLAAAVRERVTHGMLVPSQIVTLLAHPDIVPALSTFETLLSVGAPLLLEHKERLSRLKPGICCELYGLTEGGSTTVLDRDDFLRKPGSVGVPLPLAEMKVVDDDGRELPPRAIGEICGRNAVMMPGYHKRPDLTARAVRDGWLHTGDVGYLDEEGFLYLVDRKKDMIISGGVNVYPKDIEEVVVQHPAVLEAAVFGVPDPRWGEAPHCAVILRPGHAADGDALKAWINGRVGAAYQRVREVSIRPAFPRNAAGKTLKRELRAPYWEGRESRI